VIAQLDGTTVVEPGQRVTVDEHANLMIAVATAERAQCR
jgi:hypothetical protein